MSLTLVEVLRKATREASILLLHGLGLGKKVDILFESIDCVFCDNVLGKMKMEFKKPQLI